MALSAEGIAVDTVDRGWQLPLAPDVNHYAISPIPQESQAMRVTTGCLVQRCFWLTRC